jgi:transcriptional enhancer factor
MEVGNDTKPTLSGTMSGGESDTGCGMASPGTSSMDELSNDAEGIWSPDIEQSFQEALAIYPPCGRRKIILSDEGKMYGRNELIARYIKLRTGKTRSRKQVSSHIQVLSRRKAKEVQTHIKLSDPSTNQADRKEMAIPNNTSVSSPPTVTATLLQNKFSGLAPPPLQPAVTMPPSDMYFLGPAFPGGYPSAPQLWNTAISPLAESSHAASSYQLEKPIVSAAAMVMPAAEPLMPPWRDRSIAGPKLRLVELSAFVERQRESDMYLNRHFFVHIGDNFTYADPILESVDIQQFADKFPDKNGGLRELYDKGPQSAFFLVKFWADINTDIMDDNNSFYGVSTAYESHIETVIECSTKVCSFGKQVVEKIEIEYSKPEGGLFTYVIDRSPMCDYLVNFIHKLKHLPKKFMMNSVLENFTILQVVTNRETRETLLCIAYVFEVSSSDHGAQHHIYRLDKE